MSWNDGDQSAFDCDNEHKEMHEHKAGKVLFFEGAGWSKAESNGVGNCRIRATFKDKKGEAIYLEMGFHTVSKYSMNFYKEKGFKHPWHISHVFYVKDRDKHRSKEFSHLEINWKESCREYTKENILWLVNTQLGCDYDSIEVINDHAYDGFKLHEDQKEG